MARILLFISCLIPASAFACKCFKPLHSNNEVDDYMFINADLAVIVQIDSVFTEENTQYATVKLHDDLKGNFNPNLVVFSNFLSSCGIDLLALKGQKLLIIEDFGQNDMIELSQCSSHWIWYSEEDLQQGRLLDYGERLKSEQRFNYVKQLKISFQTGFSSTRFSNAVATSRGAFLNGKAHGKWVHYSFSDQVFTKGRYEHGRKEGVWVVYHYGRETKKLNGHFMFTNRIVKTGYEKGRYVNGKRHGKWLFVDAAAKDYSVIYVDGVIQ